MTTCYDRSAVTWVADLLWLAIPEHCQGISHVRTATVPSNANSKEAAAVCGSRAHPLPTPQ